MLLTTAQTLHTAISQTANLGDKAILFQFAKDLLAEHRAAIKQAVKDAEKPTAAPLDIDALLEDKNSMRKEVISHLFEESSKGNAQASDKLAKLAGLGEEAEQTTVVCVDYKNAVLDCPKCGWPIDKPVCPAS